MKRNFLTIGVFLILIITFSTFKHNVFSQTSDLEGDVILECITFTPSNHFSRLPDAVENGILSGTCSSSTKCDIFMCSSENNCTTFDPTKDQNYFGQDNTGLGLPKVKLASGNNYLNSGAVNEAAQLLNARDHTGYFLYAAHQAKPLGEGVNEENATQQLGQANLVFPAGAETCSSIYWDPYGRVFDAVSLEPLGADEARVTLLDENGNISLNALVNNVSIDKMGKYNISINKDGKYKLNVVPKTEHLFTAVEPDVKYKDLYDFIYKAGDPAFVEKAASPKRVDVPLKPKDVSYSRSPDYVYKEYKDVWFEGETYSKIDLRTVHPRTIVKVMVNGVELTEDGAGRPLLKTSDKEGFWLALIKKEILSQEGFSIELIKNPQYYPLAKNNNYFGQLTNRLISFFVKNVSAQQSIKIDNDSINPVLETSDNSKVIIFDPILDYIEGFAYDDKNKIISGAKINIKLKMNNKIYYSTMADDSGFFTVYPKNLPPYEYYLEFTDPKTNLTVYQTTSKFVANNKLYLDSEKVNLMKTKKNEQLTTDPLSRKNNFINSNTQLPKTSEKTSIKNKITNLIKQNSFFIFVLILLLIGLAIGTFIYIKKNSKKTFT